jgi:Tfp pilus assembly protein FimT
MRTTPRSRAQRGFTILEIVIVFILLAGIMSFVGPKIFEKMGQAKSAEQRIRTQTLVGNIGCTAQAKYPRTRALVTRQRQVGGLRKDADLKDSCNDTLPRRGGERRSTHLAGPTGGGVRGRGGRHELKLPSVAPEANADHL